MEVGQVGCETPAANDLFLVPGHQGGEKQGLPCPHPVPPETLLVGAPGFLLLWNLP